MSMTDDQKLKAIHYAKENHILGGVSVDFEPDEIGEDADGCWVRAWVWVPDEIYKDADGAQVVSGG